MTDFSYQLVVQNDTNTGGYSQWFFFQVKPIKKIPQLDLIQSI